MQCENGREGCLYRKHCKDVCIVVDRVPVLAGLGVQCEAGHPTGQQSDCQPYFIFPEPNSGQGRLGGDARDGVSGRVAKVDHAVQQVFEACDKGVQQHFGILHLHQEGEVACRMRLHRNQHFQNSAIYPDVLCSEKRMMRDLL